MELLNKYIEDTLGIDVKIKALPKKKTGVLPLYISETYDFYIVILLNTEFIFIKNKDNTEFKILQTSKNIDLIKKTFNKKVVLVIPELEAYNRKRLIEKGINFIVLNKQMYMPDLLIDLKDIKTKYRTNKNFNKLRPSAQFLFIFHIIHKNKNSNLENYSFKEIAKITGYTPMAISKAVGNLENLELITVKGKKEKRIEFNNDRAELWNTAERQDLLASPVIKTVFVDEKPSDKNLPYSNSSALPEYTDMNPTMQKFYAIDKDYFYYLQKNNLLKNLNSNEGKYCLEVWKYNPIKIVPENYTNGFVVDPLSLYLSLVEVKDERIEIALEQIIEKHIW